MHKTDNFVFLISFDIGSLIMIPCELKHVAIFNVISKFVYQNRTQ